MFKVKRIQNRKIKTHLAQMTYDFEHAMVKSKALSNTQTHYKYLGVAQAFKNQLSSDKTYYCNLNLKRLKHAPGSRVGLSVFIYTPNSKPEITQITKSLLP